MSTLPSYRSLSVLVLLLSLLNACSTGKVGEEVSGELLLNTGSGAALALLKNPSDGGLLTSRYGFRRHPITGKNKPHRGIDLAAPTGTPVLAAADGTLLFQADSGSFGNLSRIKHGTDVVTAYAHLDRFELGLTPGMRVEKGQVIGYVGTTGRSSGPHLHYEVLVNGEQVDPLGLSTAQIAEDLNEGLGKLSDGFESLVQRVGNSINGEPKSAQSLQQ